MEVAQDEEEEAESAQKRATRATASPRSTSTPTRGRGRGGGTNKARRGRKVSKWGPASILKHRADRTVLKLSLYVAAYVLSWLSKSHLFISGQWRQEGLLFEIFGSQHHSAVWEVWLEGGSLETACTWGWLRFWKAQTLVWGKRCLKDFWQEKGLFWKGCPDRFQKGWF